MSRSMKVMYKRIAGRWISMYETQVRNAAGELKFRELVDLNEVVWG
ncbi:hypothetical protein [Trinickia mobilis]|nr:hypothetical protein [Trinickia mobilis]